MTFDWGGATGGAAGGAMGGAPLGPIGAGVGAVVGGVLGGIGGNKKKTQQVPLETPEQRAARQMLMRFASTGQFGDFKAGQDLGLGLGDYGITAPETQGLSQLQDLLGSDIPDQFRMGDAALQDLLATSPEKIDAQFQPFKDITQREIGQSNRALKRNAGFAGNLYSSDTIRGMGDIYARGNETMTQQLANLTNQALDRRLQAIPLAYQSANAQEAIKMGRIQASQAYGDLTRRLNDAAIKARDAEILRRRQELQLPINAATTVAGGNSNFGIPSIDTTQQSPFQDVLGLAANIGGNYLGNQMFLNQYKNMFSSPSTSSTRMGLPASLSYLPAYSYGG